MVDMMVAENVVKAQQSMDSYRDADGQPNWAEWAAKYPEASRLLNEIAEEIANGE